MNIEAEVYRAIHIAKTIVNNSSIALQNRTVSEVENHASEQVMYIKENVYNLTVLIQKLESVLDYGLWDKLNNSDLDDYEKIIISYLSILDSVFNTMLSPPHYNKSETTLKIFSLAGDIESISSSVLSEGKLRQDVAFDLLSMITKLKYKFESEINSSAINQMRSEYLTKIDAEVDKIKSVLDGKLSDISLQYSDSRASLIKSVDEYKESINSFVDDAKSSIEKQKDEIHELHAEIESKKHNIEQIIALAQSSLKSANSALKASSQAGMAAAFQSRHDELYSPMRTWMVFFILSLVGLIIIGVVLIKSEYSSDISSVLKFSAKLVIAFPLIWGAWFSAKQYSHTSQLREDYAYKVAVAMTYHGYKDETAAVNTEMSGRLLDNIIAQFSDNPVRLYRNDNNVSVIEAMLKNDKFSDIINSTKNVVNSSKKTEV
ncbi:hypothetical protein [Aeromonas caviae]|uniref:hypothetical protein n=1 Tax=Aeromonas caviae TaxID=648 RepID=UPI00111AEB9F|nr:hypothetical protein [Aeromonas caviae]